MTETSNPDTTVGLQIDVLFKEYDTLRAEILSRTNNRFAITAFLGAVAAFFATRTELIAVVSIGGVVISLLVLGGIWFYLGELINKCAQRVKEIEARVNELAGTQLLEWESDSRHRPFGWSALGPLRILWISCRGANARDRMSHGMDCRKQGSTRARSGARDHRRSEDNAQA